MRCFPDVTFLYRRLAATMLKDFRLEVVRDESLRGFELTIHREIDDACAVLFVSDGGAMRPVSINDGDMLTGASKIIVEP